MAYADILRTATFTGDDIGDLIEGIFVSGFPLTMSSWSPSYSANGSMTWTSVTTHAASYVQIGKLVLFHIQATGTVGGSVSTELRFTLPVTGVSTLTTGISATVAGSATDAGTQKVAFAFFNSTSQIAVRKYDGSNYTAGTSGVAVSGWYAAA